MKMLHNNIKHACTGVVRKPIVIEVNYGWIQRNEGFNLLIDAFVINKSHPVAFVLIPSDMSINI